MFVFATIGGVGITYIHCIVIYYTTGLLNAHRSGRASEQNITNIATHIFDKYTYYPIISSIIIIIFILCTFSDMQLMFTQKCEDTISNISIESLDACNTISTCGLTLVSVYNMIGTSMYGYQTVAYIFVNYVTITTCIHLLFLLICEVISTVTNECVTYARSVLNKRGEEQAVALEMAPNWFISMYIPAPDDWRYECKAPPPPPPPPPLYNRYGMILYYLSLYNTTSYTVLYYTYCLLHYTTEPLLQLLPYIHLSLPQIHLVHLLLPLPLLLTLQ